MVENTKLFIFEGNAGIIESKINELLEKMPPTSGSNLGSDGQLVDESWKKIEDFKLENIGTDKNGDFDYVATLILSK